jgi:alcohol dehydrogenase
MSAAVNPFKAFVIRQDEHRKVVRRHGIPAVDQLDAGEVLIRVAYSSVNYKDALAATGAGKIIRRFLRGRHRPSARWSRARPALQAGRPVIATSYDIGVAHHGGYAEYARVPAGWVVPLPEGLSLFEAMALGTAASPRRWASCAWKTTAWPRPTAR